MMNFRTQQHSYFASSNNPSFSSSLLDAIYRSIDLGENEAAVVNNREEEDIMKKKQNYGEGGGPHVRRTEEEMANFRRACMIEKWMEKKVNEKANVRRKPFNDDLITTKKLFRKDREINSSSSSSDSSGYGFYSSEAESTFRRPNPVRTGNSKEKAGSREEPEKKRAGGGSFLKTKSQALKLYSDLKKVKQPVSPGGKLAGFLNALFAGGKPKKHKSTDSMKSANASSTCSSASSFSRSCLSKTPSSWKSKASSAGGAKRSVRFSPVSVIVEDNTFHQSNDKNQTSKFELPKNDSIESSVIRTAIKEELMVHALEKSRRVEEAARDLLRNYHRRSSQFEYPQLRKTQIKKQVFDDDEEEEDDDDAESCASSDLFELDHLSGIGMEELPVYETTNLGSCRINGAPIL